MSYVSKLACATLVTASFASADTDWSAWKRGAVAAIGTQQILARGEDGRYEYRWKSEWNVSRAVCTVEIKPVGNFKPANAAPEIVVAYSLNGHSGHFQMQAQRGVSFGNRLARASVQVIDCGRVDGLYEASQP
jgi:hypothetical protein